METTWQSLSLLGPTAHFSLPVLFYLIVALFCFSFPSFFSSIFGFRVNYRFHGILSFINPISLSTLPVRWRAKTTHPAARSAKRTRQSTSAQVVLHALVAFLASKLTRNALDVRERGTRPSLSRSVCSTIICSSPVLFSVLFFFFSFT